MYLKSYSLHFAIFDRALNSGVWKQFSEMQVVYHILSHQMMKNLLSGCYFYVCILLKFFHDDIFALGKTEQLQK